MKFKKKHKIPQPRKMRLRDDHTWTAPDGYKIVVLDRGAVSFNIPEKWFLAKLEPTIEIHDAEPPNDNTRISVTFWRLPPGIDWTGLPLMKMMADASAGERKEIQILARGELVRSPRTDLELVWTEHRFLDPVEKREAYSRMTIARGWDVQVLITFDFWVDDAEKIQPIWEEAIRSLQLGRTIQDPTKGVTLH